jgi:apolipoprotein N-acyltransferase
MEPKPLMSKNIVIIIIAAIITSSFWYVFNNFYPFLIVGIFLYLKTIVNTEKYWQVLLYSAIYSSTYSLFFDIDLDLTTQNFLQIDIYKAQLMSFLISFVRLPYTYIGGSIVWILEKKLKKTIDLDLKILIYSLICTISVYYIEPTIPVAPAFSFIFIQNFLYSLPLFGLSFYNFIIFYVIFSCIYRHFNLKISTFLISLNFVGLLFSSNIQKSINVRIIQFPFYEYNKKFIDPDEILKEKFSKIVAEDKNVDFSVMAESSIPFTYKDFKSFMDNFYVKTLQKSNHPIIASVIKKEKDNYYNTSILIKKDELPKFYYKNILFPIGEKYVPILSGFAETNKELNDVKNEINHFSIKNVKISPLLCFENYSDLYLSSVITSVNPDLLVVQSNESWVASYKLRNLMTKITALKAKEYNINIVKVDNQGPSVFIDYNGNIVAKIEEKEGTITKQININLPYGLAHWGVFPIIFIVLMLIIILKLCKYSGLRNQ